MLRHRTERELWEWIGRWKERVSCLHEEEEARENLRKDMASLMEGLTSGKVEQALQAAKEAHENGECGLLLEYLDRLEEMVQEARDWALRWAAFEKAMEER